MYVEEKVREAAAFLEREGGAAETALIAETGMTGFSNELASVKIVACSRVPHFPVPLAAADTGRILFGRLGGTATAVIEGRAHLHEGYFQRELAFPVRVLAALGVKNLLLLTAVTALRPGWEETEMILFSDHLDLTGGTPLTGTVKEEPPLPVPDTRRIYSPRLAGAMHDAAAHSGVEARSGVVAARSGPLTPTPAEERMLLALGADAAGFSFTAEVAMALSLGIETAACGLVTGWAEGAAGPPPPRRWDHRCLRFALELLAAMGPALDGPVKSHQHDDFGKAPGARLAKA